jgi:hypothetical protein
VEHAEKQREWTVERRNPDAAESRVETQNPDAVASGPSRVWGAVITLRLLCKVPVLL